MATSAPSLAKRMATARPMPLSPPVISATLLAQLAAALMAGVLGHRARRHLGLDARPALLVLRRLQRLLLVSILIGHDW